jgi:hypothetical protein
VLEATVTELYGDFRPGRPAAVQFVLIDLTGARPKAVLERTIGSRVDFPQASPDALARGYGTALADVLAQLVAALRASGGIQAAHVVRQATAPKFAVAPDTRPGAVDVGPPPALKITATSLRRTSASWPSAALGDTTRSTTPPGT